MDIVRQIRNKIFEYKLTVGDRLPSEKKLCEIFGVSRMTLREAIRVLELSGLVEVKVGSKGGIFVANTVDQGVVQSFLTCFKLNKFSVQDFYKARSILETGIAAEAARIHDLTYLEQLRKNLKQCENLKNPDSTSLRLSREFHVILARATHNLLLEQICKSLIELSNLLNIGERVNMKLFWKEIISGHSEIIQAFETGDVTRTQDAMSRHIEKLQSLTRSKI
ncbi:MAG: FadR/GntR family transcriptional regulator [Desulfotomaculales bacterium]